MKHEGTPFINHGVPCVGPSLIANHRIDVAGQDIHDLALAFVTPLRPDHHKISHRLPCSQKKSPGWTESQSRGAMVGAPLEFVKNREGQIVLSLSLFSSSRARHADLSDDHQSPKKPCWISRQRPLSSGKISDSLMPEIASSL